MRFLMPDLRGLTEALCPNMYARATTCQIRALLWCICIMHREYSQTIRNRWGWLCNDGVRTPINSLNRQSSSGSVELIAWQVSCSAASKTTVSFAAPPGCWLAPAFDAASPNGFKRAATDTASGAAGTLGVFDCFGVSILIFQ